MPTLEETRRFFDAIAARYDRVYAPPSEVTRAKMARLLAVLGAPKRVLDLGLGTGRELPALLDAGHAVTGVECSEEMIVLCNRRARTVPIVAADLWAPLPFAAGSFDAVISLFGSLAHPPSAGAVSGLGREAARVLSPGGVFFFEVPTSRWVAAHARHRDATSRAEIDIVALTEAEWSSALSDFSLTFDESDDELAVTALRA